MIRMIQSSSAGHAKAYFSDALVKSDYYLNDQELQGRYHGRLAERLGLNEISTKESFFALSENINPKTGQPLTPRTKEERTVVDDYIKAINKGKTALVISPTHKQGVEVTDEIRMKLRQAGMIGNKEITAKKLSNLNLTTAEKGDWRNFKEGQIIQFNQNVPGIKRGSAWSVKTITEGKVELNNDAGQSLAVPLSRADSFDVLKKSAIAISKGDKIQITRNGFDANEKRLNNGMTLEVASITKTGKITLKNNASKARYEVDRDFGHWSMRIASLPTPPRAKQWIKYLSLNLLQHFQQPTPSNSMCLYQEEGIRRKSIRMIKRLCLIMRPNLAIGNPQ